MYGGPFLLCELGGVGWFEVVEVEGEELAGAVGGPDCSIDVLNEVQSDVDVLAGDLVGRQFLEQVQGGLLDGQGNIDVLLLIVVPRHI